MKVHFHGFLKHAMSVQPEEACGFLFSDKPYSPQEEWHVFAVRNISAKPIEGWIPDKKEMLRVKARAIKMGLPKIGNIPTHPFHPHDDIENIPNPSELDLRYARRFNDIIRGIIVIDGKTKTIFGIKFHDKFGNHIPMTVESVT